MTEADPPRLRKQRALAIGLIAFFAWPMVQHALVLKYGVNPWKLGGWAMYCVPTPSLNLTIRTLGAQAAELDLDPGSGELSELIRRYRQARWSLGDLAGAPTRIAAAVLRDHSDATGVEVVGARLSFTRASAKFHTIQHVWLFERGRAGYSETTAVLH